MIYSFLAIFMVADIFMCSIESITSATKKVTVATADGGSKIIDVPVWNGSLANILLMSLGPRSAPEILLTIIGRENKYILRFIKYEASFLENFCLQSFDSVIFSLLGIAQNGFRNDDLGPNLIVGSGVFNNMVIAAISICSIPFNEVRKITNMSMFLTTAFFSLFAYTWLMIILSVSSPQRVEVWEAGVTLGLFPLLCLVTFIVEKKYISSLLCPVQREVNVRIKSLHDDAAKANDLIVVE